MWRSDEAEECVGLTVIMVPAHGIQTHMPSSVIAAMHYDETACMLTIVYRGNRGKYRYFDVPPAVWAEFRCAPSKGAYLNEAFKAREYRYERVEERPAGT